MTTVELHALIIICDDHPSGSTMWKSFYPKGKFNERTKIDRNAVLLHDKTQ